MLSSVGSVLEVFVVDTVKFNKGEESGKWFDMEINDREDIMKSLFGVDSEGETVEGEVSIQAIEAHPVIYDLVVNIKDLDALNEFAVWLSKLTVDETHIFFAVCLAEDSKDINKLMDIYDNNSFIWLGNCDNMQDAGEEYYKNLYGENGIPEHIWNYVDFGSWAEDNTEIVYTEFGYIEITGE